MPCLPPNTPVHPSASFENPDEHLLAFTGVAEALPLVVNEPTPAALTARFQWSGTGTCNIVRGFSHEDAIGLRAWASDTFAGSLPPSALGSTLLMTDGCRGGVLLEKFDGTTRAALTLSRREAWEVCIMRGLASSLGMLTPRLTRENTRRREAMTAMKAMGFKFM